MFFIKKFLKGKNKFFYSLDSILSFLGIFIGVFSILIVSSVMNGFDNDIKKRILSSKPEIIIRKKDFSRFSNYEEIIGKLKNLKTIRMITPVIEKQLIVTKDKKFFPVMCKAVNLKEYNKITNIKKHIVVGAFDVRNYLLIGMDLSLSLHSTVGETIFLSDIQGKIPTPLGLLPIRKEKKITAIFRTGLPDIDNNFVIVDMNFIKNFIQDNKIDYIQVKSAGNTRKTVNDILDIIPQNYLVEDWSQLNSNLFHAIKLEKAVMMFVLFLMILIASFNMSGFLIKFIENKQYEFAILKVMGVSQKNLKRILKFYSLYLGATASFSAILLSLILLVIQKKTHLIKVPVPGFPLSYIPVQINIKEFFFVFIFALVILYISVLYPLIKVKKVRIITVLREKS